MPTDTKAEAKTSGNPASHADAVLSRLIPSPKEEFLRGLRMVGLQIERLPAEFEGTDIKQEDLFEFLKPGLASAPVQLLGGPGPLHLSGAPTLFLNVSLFEQQPETYVYVIALELIEDVKLERWSAKESANRFVRVPTWRAQVVGFTAKGQLSQLKDGIAATGDAFAKDFSPEDK